MSDVVKLSRLLNDRQTVVDLRDWGSLDLTGNNSAQSIINAAITQATTAKAPLRIPAGTITTEGSHNIVQSDFRIVGAGRNLTRIKYVPTSPGQCFNVAAADPSLTQHNLFHMSDLTIYSTETTLAKRAIRLRNVSQASLHRIAIWGPNLDGDVMRGGDTAGIEFQGREQVSVRDCKVYAAVPLYLAENPSELGGSYDTDHFNFHNMMLATDAVAGGMLSTLQHTCVLIGNDVRLSPLSFTGFQAWVQGRYGLYWDNSAATQSSDQLYIENLLTEQGNDLTNGWSIYIIGGPNLGNGLGSLTLVNCNAESPRPGVFTRFVSHVHVIGGAWLHSSKRMFSIEKGRSFAVTQAPALGTSANESLVHFPDGDYDRTVSVPQYGGTAYIPHTHVWTRADYDAPAATTLTATATAGTTALTVASITGFANNDPVRLRLDSGRWHHTTVNGVPAGSTVTLNVAVPTGETATSGAVLQQRKGMNALKPDYVIGDVCYWSRYVAVDTGQTIKLPINGSTSLRDVRSVTIEVTAFNSTGNVGGYATYKGVPKSVTSSTNGLFLVSGSLNAVSGASPSAGNFSVYAEAADLGADVRLANSMGNEALFLIECRYTVGRFQ